MELVILAALCLGASAGIVAKVERSLGARGGTAGAARGVGRYVTGKGRAPAMTAGKTTGGKGGKKVRTGSSVRAADTRPQPSSIREAARMGWADGVQHHLDKRAAGKDFVGRSRRAVRWGGDKAGRVHAGISGAAGVIPQIKKARAGRQAKLAAAKATHDTTTETQDPPADTRTNDQKLHDLLHPDTDASRRFYALRESGYTGWINKDGYASDRDGNPVDPTNKENTMPDLNIGEMPTRSDMKTATGKLAAAVEKHREAEAAIKEAAAGFAETYRGADWGTKPIDAAAASVSEHGSAKELNTEALSEALASVDAALKQDEGLAEEAAAQGAYGRVESHA